MRRFLRVIITLICLAVLVPSLVLASAMLGLQPRHWSGIALADVELEFSNSELGRNGTSARDSERGKVTDQVVLLRRSSGWMVSEDAKGPVYVRTSSLTPPLFSRLGERFTGDEVAVIFSPNLPQLHQDIDSGDHDRVGFWEFTDPPGTWTTLMFGFPWHLGTGLLLTAAAWAVVIRRWAYRVPKEKRS